jgi:hypothetical protein
MKRLPRSISNIIPKEKRSFHERNQIGQEAYRTQRAYLAGNLSAYPEPSSDNSLTQQIDFFYHYDLYGASEVINFIEIGQSVVPGHANRNYGAGHPSKILTFNEAISEF